MSSDSFGRYSGIYVERRGRGLGGRDESLRLVLGITRQTPTRSVRVDVELTPNELTGIARDALNALAALKPDDLQVLAARAKEATS